MVFNIIFFYFPTANHPTDYEIKDEPMNLIWAKGQEPDMYVHSPPSGIEKGNPGVPDFYKRDDLRYHGKQGQRGTSSINFIS